MDVDRGFSVLAFGFENRGVLAIINLCPNASHLDLNGSRTSSTVEDGELWMSTHRLLVVDCLGKPAMMILS